MLRIGDFSKLSRISIRMLRHYDETNLLMPARTDDFTSYRYYSEAQLPAANRIKALRDMGFSLAAVAEILNYYDDPEALSRFLSVKQTDFHDEKYKENDVDVEIQMNVKGIYKNTDHVVFKTIPAVQIASATYKGGYDQLTSVNEAVANWVNDNGYEFDSAMFCIYHVGFAQTQNPDEFVTEVCYPVKKK